MSEPTADLPEPLAVLVLAWDEAVPAVRALVAATQARATVIDSLLVMVPQADAPQRLSAEEYLPLELPEAALAAPAVETDDPTEASPPLAETPPPAPATTTIVRAEALEEDGEPATDELLLPNQTVVAPAQPTSALTWSVVRVLRLGSHSLPQLAQRAGQPLPAPNWLGPAAWPAAPYLGAELPTPATLLPKPAPTPIPAALGLPSVTVAITVPHAAVSGGATAAPRPSATPPPAPALPAKPAEPPLQTATPETDFRPQEANELAQFELASPSVAVPEEATLSLAQAGWPEALAALRQPASLPSAAVPAPTSTPLAEASASPAYAALRPTAQHYPAPDLNFQIIQYARFAVPVALAEPPFAVIYAPAWPTWLAAQELRQRTGRPLVLHLATLAAPADESAETAAGWMAELQRQALHRADLVLAETPALAQRLHHELGLAASTVRVVPAAEAEAIAQALHEARPRPA